MTRTALFLFLLLVAPRGASSQSVPSEELTVEWRVGGAGTCSSDQSSCTLSAGSPIYLLNNHIEKYVQYGRREYGIDIVWAGPVPKPVKGVRLIRATGTLDPVSYGEPMALYVEGGKYLKYAEREYGINLVWSDTPVFEWKLDGGVAGRPVNSRRQVGLVNTKIGEHVVYCEREYGINLKWAKDCKRAPKPKVVAAHAVHMRIMLSGSGSSGECASSGRVRYTMKPMSITAHVSSDDRNRPGLESEKTDEVSWNKAASEGCAPTRITYLAPGSWRINATNLIDWNTNCLVDLPVLERMRTTTVDFVLKRGGCQFR